LKDTLERKLMTAKLLKYRLEKVKPLVMLTFTLSFPNFYLVFFFKLHLLNLL